MMSVDMRLNVHHRLLIAALLVFAEELSSSRGGAQAWTYNYSTSPSRRWLSARQWCRERFTDMVPVHSQQEADFLDQLLPRNARHYWIGVRKVSGAWTWVETNENIPEEAQNWATSEPDVISGQDCVELYIKRDKDTAKWNNEKCQQKKGTVCYSASCRQDSCSAHADCVETVGNFSCRCHPGFSGPSCEAIACNPLADPAHASQLCFHPFGSNRFNSSCLFSCELGFRLVGESRLLCQAGGRWSRPLPLCQAEQCPDLNHTDFNNGGMTCIHPVGPHSYNSTCEFRCDEGFKLIGGEQIRCDHSGQWTASIPACTVRRCPALFPPVSGNVTCVDAVEPFAFGSQCNFTCQDGFYLTGDHALACLASGRWSKPTPTCTVVQCSSIKAPLHAHMQCRDPIKEHSYGSTCTVHCEDGFHLIGSNVTECSSQASWSRALPDCKASRCPTLNSAAHGSLICSDPHGEFSFGSRCSTTCEEGFLLNGTADTECTSLGTWSTDVPRCLAKQCSGLKSPPHGSLICSKPHGEFSFGSQCTTTCEEGFILNGTAETECTSMGTWNEDIPQCTAKRCPTLQSPPHGSLICSKPHGEFSFGSRCSTTCEEGFIVNGTTETECTSAGTWNEDIPHCLAKQCSGLKSPPHGSLICSEPHGEFSFGSRCTTTCEEGFILNGTADTECTSMGTWSTDLPHCLAKRCPTLKSPPHGSLICSKPHGEFSFGSRCTTTCEEGFILNGTAETECTSAGTWNEDIPQCTAKRCPTLQSPPHGSLICSKPHGEFSFGSQCTTSCEEGFILNGTADTECTSLGTWSTDLPHCLAKQCSGLKSPPHGSLICSKPHGEFSFGSRCTTTCEEGFLLNGTTETECTSLGTWNEDIPQCTAKRCPTLKSPPHGSLICSKPHGEFSFGSQCTTTCEEGFVLNGTTETECTSAATWNEDIPQCTAKRCPTLQSPPHGSLICSKPHGEFSFGSRCTTTCEEGFLLNGTADTECTSAATWSTNITQCLAKTCPALSSPPHGSLFCSDPHGEFSFGSQCTTTCDEGFLLTGSKDTNCTSVGRWSRETPRCRARRCPLLAEAPQHGTINCSHPNAPFSYASTCDFECNEGFWLRGTPTMTCNTSGLWSQNLPTCQPVQCETIRDLPLSLSMNCSRPLGDFSFGSECLFSCNEGFSLNGTSMLVCSSDGFWSDGLPSCTGMSLGSAMLMYAGVGASSSVLVLILIGLVLLVMWRLRKRGPPIMTEDPAWDETENPAFEF